MRSDTDPTESSPRDDAVSSRRRSDFVRRGTVLVVAALVLATVAVAGEFVWRTSTHASPTITVTGSGTVTGAPDTLSFQVGVQTTSSSAVSALAANNEKVHALETALLAHGVSRANLQTSGLNIYPVTNVAGMVTGFSVVDDLNVTTHLLRQAGTALDAAARAVGNGVQLYGVTYSISNQSALLGAARSRAMKSAHRAASQLARGAGASLGPVLSVVDEENTAPSGVVTAAQSLYGAAAHVPLETGTQSLNVNVKVVYSLSS